MLDKARAHERFIGFTCIELVSVMSRIAAARLARRRISRNNVTFSQQNDVLFEMEGSSTLETAELSSSAQCEIRLSLIKLERDILLRRPRPCRGSR